MGAGHDGAAREMRDRLQALGYDVELRDYLDAVKPWGWVVKASYGEMLKRAPRSYHWLYWTLERGGLMWTLTRFFCTWAQRRMRRWVAAASPDVIVSTFPLAGQTLGQLRNRGRMPVPLVTFLTDFSVSQAWVHTAIDLHLAASDETARQAGLRGARRVVVAGPLVPARFRHAVAPERRAALRTELGLPLDSPLALLSAGSWGVGEVAATAREILETGVASPVVVCGYNESLRRRLDGESGVVALGWTDRMAELMVASDVLVQNAGGMSCMEAFATGLPVVTYRSIPGHGEHNAASMQTAGVAPWVRESDALAAALRGLLAGEGQRQRAVAAALFRSDPAGEVDLLVREGELATIPAPRRTTARRVRRTAGVLTASAALLWGGTGGVALATAHGRLGVVRVAPTQHQDVFVVVRPDPSVAASPALLARLRTLQAGVAVGRRYLAEQPLSVADVRRAGLPLVELGSKSVRLPLSPTPDPLVLVDDLKPDAVDLGLKWWHDDRLLVATRVVRGPADATGVHGGSVVLVDARSQDERALLAELDELTSAVSAQGLTARPVTELASTGS